MNDQPKDDRVFLAPEGYQGQLYLLGYAVKSDERWVYKMDVADTQEQLVRRQMGILESALENKVLFAFPEVNTKFRNRAADIIRRLNTDTDARTTPPDIVTQRDVLGDV